MENILHKTPSLLASSGYLELQEKFEKNKEKEWYEWLKVTEIFKPGKQGVVGVFTTRETPSSSYVFKVSQAINNLVMHEYTVSRSLNPITDYCPHFCRTFGVSTLPVDSRKKHENPFSKKEDRFTIRKEVLFLENIEDSKKLCKYIYSELPEEILFGIVKQVLNGVSIAQKECKFTHYDLHSDNIMIKKCDNHLVFLYVIDNENQFCVPTHGYYPVIIDYGFGFSDTCYNEPAYASMNHTNIGFTSDRYDEISDPKLFLITIAREINEAKESRHSKFLSNISKNLYNTLKLDWDSGWDDDGRKCLTDHVLSVITPILSVSPLFKEYEYYCIDILQGLITLPFSHNQPGEPIEIPCFTFITEFLKIEEQIGSPYFCLYILKTIIDTAFIVKIDYSKKRRRTTAIEYFRDALTRVICKIVPSYQASRVNYEKMLCSLYCLSKHLETMFHSLSLSAREKKEKQYQTLPVKSTEEILTILDVNLPSGYRYTKKTQVLVVDNIRKQCYPYRLTKADLIMCNSTEEISIGVELYKNIRENFFL